MRLGLDSKMENWFAREVMSCQERGVRHLFALPQQRCIASSCPLAQRSIVLKKLRISSIFRELSVGENRTPSIALAPVTSKFVVSGVNSEQTIYGGGIAAS